MSPWKDRDSFDSNRVPGLEDGDWPGLPPGERLEWVPVDVPRELGEAKASVLSGDFLHLEIARTDDIVNALGEAGYDCARDDHLLGRSYRHTEA